jgi:titin
VATNAGGSSAASSSVPGYTILDAPTSLAFVGSTSTTISVSFIPPSGTVTSYTISTVPALSATFNAPANSYTITNMSSNTQYTISIVATNANGNSASSSTLVRRTTLAPPTGLLVNSRTETSLTLRWTAPGGTKTKYVLSYTPTTGGSTTNVDIAGNVSTYILSGLTSGMSYNLSLVANNANGNSDPITLTGYTILSSPTGLSSTGRTINSITYSFTEPSGAIDSYSVTATPDSGSVVTKTFNAPSTSYTITGLTSGTIYTITMVATNGGGNSPSSATTENITSLVAPTNVTGGNRTTTTINISWTPPPGNIGYYAINAVNGGTTITQYQNTATATSYTITGLTSGISYNISLAVRYSYNGTILYGGFSTPIPYSTL